MSTPFDLKSRFPVPRWVPSNIMAGTVFGHTPSRKLFNPVSPQIITELEELWQLTRSRYVAEELINLSFFAKSIGGVTQDAASSIISNPNAVNTEVFQKANAIVNCTPTSQSLITFRSVISGARRKLSVSPGDPFAHLDLAFHFTTLNDLERARKHISIADRHGSSNIFIARSIARFYLHYSSDIEIALGYIRRFAKQKPSPASFASEIAISMCAELKPRTENAGFKLIKQKPEPNWDISELSSIFASIEFANGNKKAAKQFAALSLSSPNENSFAQVMSIFTLNKPGSQLTQPSFNYESEAINAYWKGDYEMALQSALQWAEFQPFSTKPLTFMSYIYSVIYDLRQKSLDLCVRGKIISPTDFTINNNIAFYQLKLGNVSAVPEAEIERLSTLCTNASETAVLTATEGLLHLRLGKADHGISLYKDAISYFEKSSNVSMTLRARLFLAEELIRIDSDKYRSDFESVCKDIEKAKERDLGIFATRLSEKVYKPTRQK